MANTIFLSNNNFDYILKQYVKKIAAKTAWNISKELTKTALEAIDKFYADYEPKYYRRHERNFKLSSFDKYYHDQGGKIFRGGVRLSPNRMQDYYQDPLQEVFDSVYAGYHGVSSMFYHPKSFSPTPRMSPSPMKIIENKRDEIVDNIQKYVDQAQKSIHI